MRTVSSGRNISLTYGITRWHGAHVGALFNGVFFFLKCDGCGSEMERAIMVEISGSAASEFESLLVIARPPDSDEVITGMIVARYFKTSLGLEHNANITRQAPSCIGMLG